MYAASDDPYGLKSRWYEQRKIDILLASLPNRHYKNAYEPGAGVAELSKKLAARCDFLTISDSSQRAVKIAEHNLVALTNIKVAKHILPQDWPDPDINSYDLIVLSEVLYFLPEVDLRVVVNKVIKSLSAEGQIVICHWKPAFSQRTVSTSFISQLFQDISILNVLARHEEDDFLLEIYGTNSRSVAQREGIR
ncbi:nodulation S family protein [Methylobacillus arboreus]|uniref:SAM-dependent methyltransferase n=1 Tax=Methylobacillus arboreus TaxID=755170 RepID=UPI001E2DD048|nr:SAM-dependent methyltransferase [Methylobacillus arboreus]MCB5191835.1 nodulation S family protein [Methylobacillus arboreus]